MFEQLSEEFKDVIKRIDSSEVIKIIQDLVRIPSENPPGKEREIAQYIDEFMRKIGLEVSFHECYPNRPNVIGKIKGKNRKPSLMLNGHLDVVTPGNIDLWKSDPFSGNLINGRIFGRGSSDMKGGIAAMLVVSKALIESNIKLRGDFLLTTVSDEEVNGIGVSDLIKRGYRADMAVIGEPTDLIPIRAHKGLIWFKITTHGVSKHSSFSTSTISRKSNAILHMARILENIKKYHSELEKKNDDLVGSPTLNVGTIRGGSKINVIPDTCSITLDRRILPYESPQEVESELRLILENLEKENSNLKIDLEVILSRRGAVTSENELIVKLAKESAEEVLGRQVQVSGCPATSDMEAFVNDAKIPTILLGPGRLSETHMVDEFIEVDQVMKAIKIYGLIIHKALM